MNTQETGQSKGKQMRITNEEKALIKAHFKGNDELLLIIRKIFLPEIDPQAPLGQVIDLWMSTKIDDMSPEEAIINMKARNNLIAHIDQMLMQLKLIAELDLENQEQVTARLKKNSSK